MQFKRRTVDQGCDDEFRVYKETKLVQSICFLTVVHTFTHVRSSIHDEKYRCLILEFTQQVEDLVTYKLPEARTIRVLFHACAVQKPILSLACLAQQLYWSDFRADTGTLFLLDKTQVQHS